MADDGASDWAAMQAQTLTGFLEAGEANWDSLEIQALKTPRDPAVLAHTEAWAAMFAGQSELEDMTAYGDIADMDGLEEVSDEDDELELGDIEIDEDELQEYIREQVAAGALSDYEAAEMSALSDADMTPRVPVAAVELADEEAAVAALVGRPIQAEDEDGEIADNEIEVSEAPEELVIDDRPALEVMRPDVPALSLDNVEREPDENLSDRAARIDSFRPQRVKPAQGSLRKLKEERSVSLDREAPAALRAALAEAERARALAELKAQRYKEKMKKRRLRKLKKHTRMLIERNAQLASQQESIHSKSAQLAARKQELLERLEAVRQEQLRLLVEASRAKALKAREAEKRAAEAQAAASLENGELQTVSLEDEASSPVKPERPVCAYYAPCVVM